MRLAVHVHIDVSGREETMTRVVIVASQVEMRHRIVECLKDSSCPLVSVALRSEAARLLKNTPQVLVYGNHQGGDAAWIAGEMEEHPGLRVVYLSQQPWSSLNY